MDKNINILIVDDYKTMLRIVRSLLIQLGFSNIDEASDGSMALVSNANDFDPSEFQSI
jgi:two-component system chemotaxis response regulator CheY